MPYLNIFCKCGRPRDVVHGDCFCRALLSCGTMATGQQHVKLIAEWDTSDRQESILYQITLKVIF